MQAPRASTSRCPLVYENSGLGMTTRISRSVQRDGAYRIDMRQMARDARPAFAFIAAAPDFSAGRAKVEAHRITRVRTERLTLDRPPRLLARKAAILTLPGIAAIARAVRGRFAAGTHARPYLGAVHRKHPQT